MFHHHLPGETSSDALSLASLRAAASERGSSACKNSISSGTRPFVFSLRQSSYISFSVKIINLFFACTISKKSISALSFWILAAGYLPPAVMPLLVEIFATMVSSVLTASKTKCPPDFKGRLRLPEWLVELPGQPFAPNPIFRFSTVLVCQP